MKKNQKRRKKEYLSHFTLAGFTYYDGVEVFNELKVGTLLEIQRETDNPYDPMAIMIFYNDYHLGYIPQEENAIFYKLLKVGINNIELRIQSIAPQEHPESQIRIVAHLVENK